ncbi:hypothetical protein AV654_19855 [Paenibacillus elgii]|uniref:Uncharacterized protein n=1 Tax=Paenibacillus elgii TaxID=189691 RepID=A0A163XPI8_9BACL|nr:hypothetical protein [Paenibacillus elgii]KZE78230.1 hypothetical protein AV654_19855 [Paenibacillus elgii]
MAGQEKQFDADRFLQAIDMIRGVFDMIGIRADVDVWVVNVPDEKMNEIGKVMKVKDPRCVTRPNSENEWRVENFEDGYTIYGWKRSLVSSKAL